MATATDHITLELYAYNPTTPPAWRWNYAQKLLSNHEAQSCGSADPWVTRTLQHLSADRTASYPNRSDKPRFDPSIEQAHRLPIDSSEQRNYLEALLLTGESFPRIARRCHLPIAVVEAYTQLFFDVRPRLGARDWIMSHVIRCYAFNNYAGAEEGDLWKLYAAFGGIYVLDTYMAATGEVEWPDWLPDAVGSDDPAVIERFKEKLRLTYRFNVARTDAEVEAILAAIEHLRAFDDPFTPPPEELRKLQGMERYLKGRIDQKRKPTRPTKSKPRNKSQRDRTSTPPIDDPTKIVRKPK